MTPVWGHLRKLFARIAGSLRRRNFDAGFDEEIRTHLALLAERFARQGMSRDEAEHAARRQFGGIAQLKNELGDRSRFGPFDRMKRNSVGSQSGPGARPRVESGGQRPLSLPYSLPVGMLSWPGGPAVPRFRATRFSRAATARRTSRCKAACARHALRAPPGSQMQRR